MEGAGHSDRSERQEHRAPRCGNDRGSFWDGMLATMKAAHLFKTTSSSINTAVTASEITTAEFNSIATVAWTPLLLPTRYDEGVVCSFYALIENKKKT